MELLHRKERIILSTIEVIDEYGIQGFSTREVARRQGISESTIFKHFGSKNQLILAVLDHYSQYDEDIIKSIELKKIRGVEAINYFIQAYTTYYENYPAITAITQVYDILNNNSELAGTIKKIFITRIKAMERFVREAQEEGAISFDVDAEKLAIIMVGSYRTICLKWRMERYSFSLKEQVLSTLKMILDVFIKYAAN
ncbi:TetR/AcrR family transcriptional regulator [Clostridium formicaceticum]|uniref:Nucleoid occlusion factor SlmA n=1 Tax=Clostridium formicaceticum TaxID=1497 RepID=A0AAC9WHW3_9CLOT|nr:TetR/AcrR family transcriptional regulator [Clostridium formicaceticum]ARE89368.1 Nucleoid occlusion factor SlmA [Clostridium formicaceticum]